MKRVNSAEEWESLRAQGRTRYMLRTGVLGRGIPLGVLLAVAIEFALASRFPDFLRTPIFWVRLVGLIAVFSASGCLNARTTWNLYEKRFGTGAAGGPRAAR